MCLATECVVLAVAALALNRLVGYTGLVSFGHGVWFGLGAYGVALSQRHLFEGQMLVPALVTLVMTAAVAVALGFLILRRRGVYFSLRSEERRVGKEFFSPCRSRWSPDP